MFKVFSIEKISMAISPELVLLEFSDVSLIEAFLALVIPMQPPILHNRSK